MKLTEISIAYTQTYNLGNYSNVKPEIRLTAVLEDGDNPEQIMAELQAQAQAHIHEVIDTTLEEQGDAPHFWKGPRYDLVEAGKDKILVIIPAGQREEMPGDWSDLPLRQHGWRLPTLQQHAHEKGRYTVLDCSDGDFSHLPDMVKAKVIRARYEHKTPDKYLLVIRAADEKQLPEVWQSYWLEGSFVTRSPASLLATCMEQAEEQGLTLIDCLDGDLSRVPDLRFVEDKVREEEEEIPYEVDDYDDREDDE
jgi:hypothetical protein